MFGAPKAISPGDDRAGLRDALGLVVGGEVLVREVDEPRDAGIDGCDHRGTAHGVDVDLDADFLRFVHDRLEHFDL